MPLPALPTDITTQVAAALREDLGSGDLTADLIDDGEWAQASVVTRERAVLCGTAWFNQVFAQLDADIRVDWHARDGDRVHAEQSLCTLQGPARGLLSGERTALNFLQTLSATATVSARYCDAVKGTGVRILDTRKTIPGLRRAQKYAVACGGGQNHRLGLFDAILIKENHIASSGSIGAAVATARQRHGEVRIEVEVENLTELERALSAEADVIMLDNFDLALLREAVQLTAGRALLEASGNISLDSIQEFAATGVDYISVGALTKDVRAIDLSMQFQVV